MVEKSHILKSPFIQLYVCPTYFNTEVFFCQNNQFLTVAASIFDSICLMSSHACRMPCRAGAETKQSQRVREMLYRLLQMSAQNISQISEFSIWQDIVICEIRDSVYLKCN